MSIAFQVHAVRTGAVRLLHAATLALAACGFALAAWIAPASRGGAWLAAGIAACWLAWRGGARGLSWGRLAVDAQGQGCWQPDGASAATARPARIECWCATERLVWLRWRDAGDGRRRDTLIARDACDAGQWRSLRAWLCWLGRGPA